MLHDTCIIVPNALQVSALASCLIHSQVVQQGLEYFPAVWHLIDMHAVALDALGRHEQVCSNGFILSASNCIALVLSY